MATQTVQNPLTSRGTPRNFRVLAINGNHIAIAGDFPTWQHAVDARREWEAQIDREDPTWFDITPLFDAEERSDR